MTVSLENITWSSDFCLVLVHPETVSACMNLFRRNPNCVLYSALLPVAVSKHDHHDDGRETTLVSSVKHTFFQPSKVQFRYVRPKAKRALLAAVLRLGFTVPILLTGALILKNAID